MLNKYQIMPVVSEKKFFFIFYQLSVAMVVNILQEIAFFELI